MRANSRWESLLGLGLCAMVSAQEPTVPPPPNPSRSSPSDPATPEQRLLAALRAEEPAVRGEAAYVLGLCGDARHVDAVGPLIEDDASAVRNRAINALSLLARDEAAGARAAPWLLKALHDGVEMNRRLAANALGKCAPRENWDDLRSCLGDPAPSVRIVAGMSLAKLGAPADQRDVVSLLQSFAGGSADRQLAQVLDLLVDPTQHAFLEPLLHSYDPAVGSRAQDAAARLHAIARGEPLPESAAQRRRRQFHADHEAARAALRRLPWREIRRDALLRAVVDARLVLFGESHSRQGPLRDAQRELLRHWASGDPAREVLGYEPSARRAQALVLEAAKSLGMETRSLEPSLDAVVDASDRAAEADAATRARVYAEQGARVECYLDRDEEAAAIIAAHLAADPKHRMFVIRGEAHVVPGGSLVQQLAEPPVIVLSGSGGTSVPPLHALGGELRFLDRIYRVGDSGRLFVWMCQDPVGPPLREWLEGH